MVHHRETEKRCGQGHLAVVLGVFVIKGKVSRFEALAPKLNGRQTDSGFSENATGFCIYRLVSVLLREKEIHPASLFMQVHLA
jgi:hypothetical protein